MQQNADKQKFSDLRTVWLAIPLATSFIVLNFTPLKEGDLWWHLKLGELIATTHTIAKTDIFSFTATGQPYFFSYSWLSDVLFFLLEKAGGLAALIVLQAVVSTLIVALLLRESQKRGAFASFAAAISLLAFFYHFIILFIVL